MVTFSHFVNNVSSFLNVEKLNIGYILHIAPESWGSDV